MLELEAVRDVALAAGDATGLDRVLELVAKRGRALIDAQSTLLVLGDGSELVVAASSGYADPPRGQRVPVPGSVRGEVIEGRSALRIGVSGSRTHLAPADPGFPTARTGGGVADSLRLLVLACGRRVNESNRHCCSDGGSRRPDDRTKRGVLVPNRASIPMV